MTMLTIQKDLLCRAYSRLSVTTVAVVTLEASKVNHATYGPAQAVHLVVEDADIRYTYDGTTPTTGADGTGAPMITNSQITLYSGLAVKNLKMIGLSTTAVVHAFYYYDK